MAGWKRRKKGERVPKPLIKKLRDYGLWQMFIFHYYTARMRPRQVVKIRKKGEKTYQYKQWKGLGLGDRESFLYAWKKMSVKFLKGFLKEHGVEMELPDKPPEKTTEELIWDGLWDAGLNKTCGLKEENDWVAENAYKNPGDIHRPSVPSRQAVNSLRAICYNETAKLAFFRSRQSSGTSKTALDDDASRASGGDEPMDDGTKTVLNTIEKMKKAGKPA